MLWTALSVIWALSLHAQQYGFRYYGQLEGLENLTITSMTQDRTGLLWVGTENGVFRYDGSHFRRYHVEDGLPGSCVKSIFSAPDGTLWVGACSGLTVRAGERFSLIKNSFPLIVTARTGIAADTSGHVYFGTMAGLVRADADRSSLQQYRFTQLTTQAEVAGQPAYGVAAGAQGEVWFGCGKRVCRWQDGQLRLYGVEQGLPEEPWEAILLDTRGTVWARSLQHLRRLDPGAGNWVSQDENLPKSSSSAMLSWDRFGRLMAPTDYGLATWQEGRWRITGMEQGLSSEPVTHVMQDREGSVWLAQPGGGLARWLGYGEWENWRKSAQLPSELVWTIRRDGAGRVWFGHDRGVTRADLTRNEWRTWGRAEGLTGDRVRSVAITRDESVWLGMFPGGVCRISPSGKVDCYRADSGLTGDRVLYVLTDAEDRLWVCTRTGLFRSADLSSGVKFERQAVPWGDERESFFSAYQDHHGALWFAASRGLVRWANGAWRRYGREDGLRDPAVAYITEAPDHSYWIGYRDGLGLSRLVFGQDRVGVTHLAKNEGIRSDKSIFLTTDTRGAIWYGSDSGVDVLENGTWRHFGQADGLVWDDCSGNAVLADSDGTVWVGTSRGVSHYRRSPNLTAPVAPPVLITRVQVEAGRPPAERSASLPPNSFSARFTAVTFVHEEAVRFQYRLIGLHENWADSAVNEVLYPNLSPGGYTFEVRARSAAGVWSKEPARFAFRISPMWYQALWFRVSVGLVALVVALWLWRSRMQRLLLERHRLERAVQQRTRELSEEKHRAEAANALKGEFLANMSHELRTPMHAVLGMTDLALETDLTPQQRQYLEAARSSASSLLAILNDVLDYSRFESGRFDLDPGEFSLRENLSEVVKAPRIRAQQKLIALDWSIAPDVPDRLLGDSLRVNQILANLLNNAIKFTEQGSVHLNVARLTPASSDSGDVTLHFTVSDTGIGIAPEKQGLIFDAFRQADGSTTRKYGGTGLGLAICSRLVELLGGRIWVESRVGDGSRFHFTARFGEVTGGLEPVLEGPNGAVRVLVAEDNPVNQLLARRLLEKRGYQVSIVGNGREALEAVKREMFDLLLLDVQMPEMDGLEAAVAIRRYWAEMSLHRPILAMTAHDRDGTRERCLQAGIDGYLRKPIHMRELYDAIDGILRAPASDLG